MHIKVEIWIQFTDTLELVMIDVTAMLIASMVKFVIQMVNATNTVQSPVIVCQLITAIGNFFL